MLTKRSIPFIGTFLSRPMMSALLLLSIGGANDVWAAAPIANPDNRTVSVNSAITINVLNNDSDPDGDDIRLVSVAQPQNGRADINSDGGITFTPNEGYQGNVTFTYVIEDIVEVPEQAQGTVTVRVVPLAIYQPEQANQNQLSVANALASACEGLGLAAEEDLTENQQELLDRCIGLREIAETNPDALPGIAEQISPEETLALIQTNASLSNVQTRAITQHLSQGGGVTPTGLNSFIWSHSQPFAAAGRDTIQSRFSVFTSVSVVSTERDKSEFENGYDNDSYGLTVGLDYALSAESVLGVAIGNTQSELSFNDDDGQMDTEMLSLIAYAQYYLDDFAFDVQLGYDQLSTDISRKLSYMGIGELVEGESQGESDGDQFFITFNTDYNYFWRGLNLTPFAQLEYRSGETDGYEEIGLAGYDVRLASRGYTHLNLNVGINSQYAWNQNWGVLLPTFSLQAVSNVQQDQDDIAGRFLYSLDDADGFVLEAEDIDSFYVRSRLGLSALFPRGISGFINLETVSGQDYYTTYQYNAGLRVEL